MTTLIDGVEVKIEWEKEKTLSDVRSGLRDWLAKQDYELVSLLANGKAVQPDNLPLEQIETLEVETVPTQNKPLQTLLLLKNFFDLVQKSLDPFAKDVIGELEQEFSLLQPCFFPFLNPFQDRLSADLALFSLPWKNPLALKEPAQRLYNEFTQICEEWISPQEKLEENFQKLQTLVPQLQDIAVLFQKGQDKQAMNLLLTLLGLLQEINHQATKQQQPWQGEDDLKLIMSFLSELKEALETNDFVLLADLIEYELCPRIEIFLDRNLLPS